MHAEFRQQGSAQYIVSDAALVLNIKGDTIRLKVDGTKMPGIASLPILRYISTFFGLVFLGFGVTYLIYPRTGYSMYGFSTEPTTRQDWAIMERVMMLFGAKDLFMSSAILTSTWLGTRKSAALVLLGASACAGVDGYVVKQEAGTNEWNHWGYGSMIGIIGLLMSGVLG